MSFVYLVILRSLEIRGTQRVALDYAEALRGEFEAKVTFVSVEADGPLLAKLRSLDYHHVCTSDFNADLLQTSPDLIHVHREGWADITLNAMLVGLRRMFPNAVILETNVFARVDYKIPRGVIDAHLQLTRYSLRKWANLARASKGGTGVYLPYCSDIERFRILKGEERRSARRAKGLAEGAVVIGRIGAPSQSKWHSITVKSFEAIATSDPGVQLYLVGPPPSVRSQVDALAADVRSRVVIEDFINGDSALCEAYGVIDVFAHGAEIGESFGMVLLEAMLCGVRIVTLATPLHDNAQVEVVGNSPGGRVAWSEAAFESILWHLVEEVKKEGGSLSLQIRSSAVKEFGKQVVSDRLVLLYGLLKAQKVRPVDLQAQGFDCAYSGSTGGPCLPIEVRGATRLLYCLVNQPWIYRFYSNVCLPLKIRLYRLKK